MISVNLHILRAIDPIRAKVTKEKVRVIRKVRAKLKTKKSMLIKNENQKGEMPFSADFTNCPPS